MFVSWTDFLLSYPQRESLLLGFVSFPLSGIVCPWFLYTLSQSPVVAVDLDQALTLLSLTPSLYLSHFHSPNDSPSLAICYFSPKLFSTLFLKLKLSLFLLPWKKNPNQNHRKLLSHKGKAKQSKTDRTLHLYI